MTAIHDDMARAARNAEIVARRLDDPIPERDPLISFMGTVTEVVYQWDTMPAVVVSIDGVKVLRFRIGTVQLPEVGSEVEVTVRVVDPW